MDKVVAEGPGVPRVEIAATSTDWTVNGKTSDPAFVEEVLGNISRLEASDYPASADPSVLEPARLTITITKKGPAHETLRLVVGKATDKEEKSFFARAGDGELAVISVDDYKKIVPREETLIATGTPVVPKFVFTPPVPH
jgi:hypothetical protein